MNVSVIELVVAGMAIVLTAVASGKIVQFTFVKKLSKEIEEVMLAHEDAVADGKWNATEVKKMASELWDVVQIFIPKLGNAPWEK